jgi:hypothetical protein
MMSSFFPPFDSENDVPICDYAAAPRHAYSSQILGMAMDGVHPVKAMNTGAREIYGN